jgi:hypothetical protein
VSSRSRLTCKHFTRRSWFLIRVRAADSDLFSCRAKILLNTPAATEIGEKVALSRRIDKHWRLIGKQPSSWPPFCCLLMLTVLVVGAQDGAVSAAEPSSRSRSRRVAVAEAEDAQAACSINCRNTSGVDPTHGKRVRFWPDRVRVPSGVSEG